MSDWLLTSSNHTWINYHNRTLKPSSEVYLLSYNRADKGHIFLGKGWGKVMKPIRVGEAGSSRDRNQLTKNKKPVRGYKQRS